MSDSRNTRPSASCASGWPNAKITTLYGWQAETVRQTGDDVFVTIAERDGDRREEIHGRYVVGCDGSRSLVRNSAGITQSLEDADV